MIKPHSIKYQVEETNVNFYAWQLITDGQEGLNKYFGPTIVNMVTNIKNDVGLCGFEQDMFNGLGRRILHMLEHGGLDPKVVARDHTIPGEKIMALCRLVRQQDLAAVSNNRIALWFKELWGLYLKLNAAGWIPVLSDYEHNYLSNRLVEILGEHGVKVQDIQNYLSLLVGFNQPTLYWQEEADLLAIAKQYKTKGAALKSPEFRRHVQEYFWLNYGYQGPIWTPEDFKTKVDQIFSRKAPVSRQLAEHANKLGHLAVRQEQLVRRLKLNKTERHLFETARLFMYLKAYRIEVRHSLNYVSDLLFTEISGRTGLPVTVFRYALRQEILQILRGKKVDERKIAARRKGMVHVRDGKKLYFVPPAQVKSFLKRVIVAEKYERSSVITGQAAYLGRARGQVKIVKGIADIPKVKHGDILVAPATSPDVLPAMYKALAFVTDTGGITSHAAIVAREMKKPCVIGTKIATKVLRDGDWVEVDAVKGEVRLLE